MADAGTNTRQLLIKGTAAEQYMKTKGRKGGRRGTRKMRNESDEVDSFLQKGGDAPPGAPITNAKNYNAAARLVKNAGPVMVQKGGDPPVASTPGHSPQDMTKAVGPAGAQSPAMAAQLNAGTNPPTVVSQGGVQTGGAKKVVLAPKKKSRSKVVLAAAGSGGAATGPAKRKSTPLTQTRKIRVGLSSLKKRLTRAKTISKDSKEKSIAEIRKVLEEAKLVKPAAAGKGAVPESVLRDIYKDYLLLRSKAL